MLCVCVHVCPPPAAGAKDAELELQYKSSYARIMDAKRRCVWSTCELPAMRWQHVLGAVFGAVARIHSVGWL